MIVIFPRPSEKVIARWQLAVEKDIAHLITLPHVPHKVVDLIVAQIVTDLKKVSVLNGYPIIFHEHPRYQFLKKRKAHSDFCCDARQSP